MASTDHPEDGVTNPIPNEEEPLLGSNGSVTQKDATPIYYNFLTGRYFLYTQSRIDLVLTSLSLQELLWLLKLVSGW